MSWFVRLWVARSVLRRTYVTLSTLRVSAMGFSPAPPPARCVPAACLLKLRPLFLVAISSLSSLTPQYTRTVRKYVSDSAVRPLTEAWRPRSKTVSSFPIPQPRKINNLGGRLSSPKIDSMWYLMVGRLKRATPANRLNLRKATKDAGFR